MHEEKAIFLTRDEAMAAIQADLQQYAPQVGLLCELYPLVAGPGAVAVKDADERRVWIKQVARGPMRPVSFNELADALFNRIAGGTGSLELVAELCARVFTEPAAAGFDRQTRTPGIWVKTGMDGYRCRQCGQCCRVLDYHRECTPADIERWQSLGRDDILKWVRRVPGPAGTAAYRIWVAPGSEQPAAECPFLQHEPETARFVCGIHEIKPDICRQYPFTRKHARMTGCPGFDQD